MLISNVLNLRHSTVSKLSFSHSVAGGSADGGILEKGGDKLFHCGYDCLSEAAISRLIRKWDE